MTVPLSKKAESIVDSAVASGQFSSREAAIEASVELLDEYIKKREWLRQKVRRSIERGGRNTLEDIDKSVENALDAWERDCGGRPKAAE